MQWHKGKYWKCLPFVVSRIFSVNDFSGSKVLAAQHMQKRHSQRNVRISELMRGHVGVFGDRCLNSQSTGLSSQARLLQGTRSMFSFISLASVLLICGNRQWHILILEILLSNFLRMCPFQCFCWNLSPISVICYPLVCMIKLEKLFPLEAEYAYIHM